MTGRYQEYPEYKGSGVEWLELLPSDWQTMKVKFLLKDGSEGIKIGPFGSALKLEDMVQKGIRVYGQENVIKRDFTLGKRFISQKKYNEMKVYTADEGDILITMMGTSGKCQVVPSDADLGIIDSHLLKIRTNKRILPELFRLLVDEAQEVKDQIGKQGKGSIMHGLNSTIVKDLEFPLPSVEEQRKILNFLNHETAKIDTLIAKQEKLIELLKEKRQAVISHAVTRGISSQGMPNAQMKDSGVEWLGEVPEHWVVSKFSYEIDFLEGPGILAVDFHEEGIPLLRIQDVKEEFVTDNFKTFLDPVKVKQKWEHFKVEKGDLIISASASTGLISEVGNRTVGAIPYTGLIRLKPISESITKDFIRFFVQSDLFFEQIKLFQTGSTIQHFGPIHLQQMKLVLPPVDEQIALTQNIVKSINKIDALISNAESFISLTKERKTALISAAVTGKIDVRNWSQF